MAQVSLFAPVNRNCLTDKTVPGQTAAGGVGNSAESLDGEVSARLWAENTTSARTDWPRSKMQTHNTLITQVFTCSLYVLYKDSIVNPLISLLGTGYGDCVHPNPSEI